MLADDIRTEVQRLSKDDSVQFRRLAHSDQAFGSTVAELSVSGLDVRFVSDKGDVWCEILVPAQPAEWFFYDDMASVLGIPATETGDDLLGAIKATVKHLQQHLMTVSTALDQEHFTSTRQQLQELIKRRILRTYGPLD